MTKTIQKASTRPLVDAVREVMKQSYMDEERDEAVTNKEHVLGYGTRENGDMESDRAGRADVEHARAMKAAILAAVPEVTVVRLETVDEWTLLTVTVPL